jgi:hypothetical protein
MERLVFLGFYWTRLVIQRIKTISTVRAWDPSMLRPLSPSSRKMACDIASLSRICVLYACMVVFVVSGAD